MQKVTIILAILFFTGCKSDQCREAINPTKSEVSLDIERIEPDLIEANSAKKVEKLLSENRTLSQLFLHSGQYPHDSILAGRLFTLLQNPYIDTLFEESRQAFSDFNEIESQLETLVMGIQSVYPNAPTPKVKTIVSGLYNDLYVSDSLIVIGLDYFIGEGATYRPIDIPEYILRRYNNDHLVPTIGKFLAGDYVNLSRSESFLSDMIDYGKTTYFLGRLLPCVPEHIIMGWTEEELQKARENQTIIWANFVENEVLYETNHLTKRKFLGERPNVYEISQECPGRIGAWIGWKIVESYMQNNEVTIPQLLKQNNNEELFRVSGYKPKNS
ncbi:MAG: gliding motility lipoprotein GldB [Cyclobacteriaceae bacterium]